MKNNACRMTMARAQTAHAMPKIDPIHAARALHRAMVYGKGNGIPLSERDDFRARLHAWPLLGQQNSPPVKSRPGSDNSIVT